MDEPLYRSRSLSRPPPYEFSTAAAEKARHQRAASGGSISSLTASKRSLTTSATSKASTTATAPSRTTAAANTTNHNNAAPNTSTKTGRPSSPGVVSSSFLEPRIAVALRIPKSWRPWLFFSRLLAICPAIYWGLQPALQLLLRAALALPLSAMFEAVAGAGAAAGLDYQPYDGLSGVRPRIADVCAQLMYGAAFPSGRRFVRGVYPWTEMSLGVVWCGVSAYLSFFFADNLMSRWLINYSPQAAIIRLLTINCANAFLTERVLFMVGGFDDSRLLLPGWISIATTLTVCYHITQRKINIRKETSTSINIFSMASFLSMVALLAHLHSDTTDYPVPPVLRIARLCLEQWERLQQGR